MHPILRDPRRLALYLATWAILGTLLAALAALGLTFADVGSGVTLPAETASGT